jgi:DNA-directed RNA polymerase subunit H (RpoH/RPB5)
MEEKIKDLPKIFLKEPLIKKYSKKTWDDVQDVRKSCIYYKIFKTRFYLISINAYSVKKKKIYLNV